MKSLIKSIACAILTLQPFSSQEACAQITTYQPLLKEGKVWFTKGYYEYKYVIEGDTVIHNQCYKRLYRTERPDTDSEQTYYYGAALEEDRKVYLIMAGEEERVQLYNFTDEPRDTLRYYMPVDGEDLLIFETRILLQPSVAYHVDDTYRRMYGVWGDFMAGEGIIGSSRFITDWIEGIGSQKDVFHLMYKQEWQERLNYCYEDGICLYDINNYLKYKVSMDAVGITDITPFSAEGGSSIYDLTGRRLDHEPSQGLYIKDGRKVLKR